MTYLEQYLIWAIVLILLACIIYAARLLKRRKAATGEKLFITTILQQALQQQSLFELKLNDRPTRSGLSATMTAIEGANLLMHAQSTANEAWSKRSVEVFFRVVQPEGPVFYAFNSITGNLKTAVDGSTFILAYPEHLRVEKKRHFARFTPNQDDILMIAVWPVAPGRRLPRSNSDMGHPALAWKNGQADKAIQIENVSGGGIALRISITKDSELPFPADKGRQLFCLLVYNDAGQRQIFWCSGEIMNVRKTDNAVSLGLEFTNWALQEQGINEIHWTHSSPWQGVKPMLNWAKEFDKPKHHGEENLGSGA